MAPPRDGFGHRHGFVTAPAPQGQLTVGSGQERAIHVMRVVLKLLVAQHVCCALQHCAPYLHAPIDMNLSLELWHSVLNILGLSQHSMLFLVEVLEDLHAGLRLEGFEHVCRERVGACLSRVLLSGLYDEFVFVVQRMRRLTSTSANSPTTCSGKRRELIGPGASGTAAAVGAVAGGGRGVCAFAMAEADASLTAPDSWPDVWLTAIWI